MNRLLLYDYINKIGQRHSASRQLSESSKVTSVVLGQFHSIMVIIRGREGFIAD